MLGWKKGLVFSGLVWYDTPSEKIFYFWLTSAGQPATKAARAAKNTEGVIQ